MGLHENIAKQLLTQSIGEDIFALAAKIYPICRSITGDGVRETLREIGKHIQLEVHEVPTGTSIFDWTVPREWNIRDAYIKDGSGKKIVELANSNLHVMSYSTPVHRHVSLQELREHVHTLPEQPELIPYRTSYYSEGWAFCMSHHQFEGLRDETFEVYINSSLKDGFLTYGEYLHKGHLDEEVILSAHVCHPSLANDNCSGVALLTCLAERLSGAKTKYSYRFLFAPGTIGAITWLARNEDRVQHIAHGLIVSMVGDGGGPTYKKSRRGNVKIDRAFGNVLRHSGLTPEIADFSPYGYDERQFCSPGFNLPVGLFQRSKFGTIPQYHTSADNLEFIRPKYLAESYRLIAEVLDVIENDDVYWNTIQKCEPQLGRRGLYTTIDSEKDAVSKNMAMLWILNLSDGCNSLLDIAEQAELPFGVVLATAQRLQHSGLLKQQSSCL